MAQHGLFMPFIRDSRFRTAAQYAKTPRILDVGCQKGYLRKFLPSNIEYVGIDLHEPFGADFPYYVRSVTDDLSDLGTFDSIFMLATIEHIKEYQSVVDNLAPRLNPGGVLILTTPSPIGDKVHHLGSKVGLFSSVAAHEHEKIFNLAELRELIQKSGLEVSAAHTFQFGLNQVIVGRKK